MEMFCDHKTEQLDVRYADEQLWHICRLLAVDRKTVKSPNSPLMSLTSFKCEPLAGSCNAPTCFLGVNMMPHESGVDKTVNESQDFIGHVKNISSFNVFARDYVTLLPYF